MTKIKICGITSYEDASCAIDAGVTILGFNFCKASPRYIEPAKAREIVELLPPQLWFVGVFVNTPMSEVLTIAQNVQLNTLQFHGDEDQGYLQQVQGWRTIKAVRLGASDDKRALETAEVASFVLLDSYALDSYGGTGRQISEGDLALLDEKLFSRAFLAGGLTPDNVCDKIGRYRPYAVDVASGVEERPGKKSGQLIRSFVEEVLRAG